MNRLFKTFCFLFIFLLTGFISQAQNISYKAINSELQILQKQLLPDKRDAVLEIILADTLETPVVIKGVTSLPEVRPQVEQWLASKNILFVDSIRLLPDAAVGDKYWGLVALSVANLRAMPDHASEMVSQCLMGTPLKVLDFNGKWYQVQTPENYYGWVDSAAIRTLDEAQLKIWKTSDRYVFNQLTGLALDQPKKNGQVVTDLVMDNLFVVIGQSRGYLKIELPDGRQGFVRKKDCTSFNTWISINPTAKAILDMASQMLGSPYLWGGTSVKGCDCSGFVKQAFYSQAVILTRDASQQARYGDAVDFNLVENLQPADLLFFGSSAQRIGHVGMYLGDGYFIHCSGKVHISSLLPGNPKYNRKRNLVSARRVVNTNNPKGIIKVKDHPWYVNNN